MSLVLLFPGQGTQHADMLPWLEQAPEAEPALALLADRLGAGWRQRLAQPGWASENRTAQALLTGLSLAAWQSVSAHLPTPSLIAGYSVGELPAFVAAGVFGAAQALALADARAEAMSRSVGESSTGLLAVTGPSRARLDALCARWGLALAIDLGTDKAVLGGPVEGLGRAQVELETEGARCQRLAVNLASHTPWMRAALPAFALAGAATGFSRPAAPLVCNLTGLALRGEAELRAALVGQIAQPVRWATAMQTIDERRPRCVLEVGPGSSLSKLWNERHPGVLARSVDDFRSVRAVVDWVLGRLQSTG
jgi:[acyl-carrier-protein] S-malonyltransferase